MWSLSQTGCKQISQVKIHQLCPTSVLYSPKKGLFADLKSTISCRKRHEHLHVGPRVFVEKHTFSSFFIKKKRKVNIILQYEGSCFPEHTAPDLLENHHRKKFLKISVCQKWTHLRISNEKLQRKTQYVQSNCSRLGEKYVCYITRVASKLRKGRK